MAVFYVAIGGAVGSAGRYLLTVLIQSRVGAVFPVGTLLVNVSGALLLGFLAHYTANSPGVSGEMRLMLTTGLCGGYTTFSTFSYESVRLIEDGEYGRAGAYVGMSVALSLVGIVAGFSLARALLAARRGMA